MDLDDIVDFLESQNMLQYGKIIPRVKLEKYLEEQYDPASWQWLGKFLLLKQKIEDRGVFTTQRGCKDGDLRIMHQKEMAKKCRNVLNSTMRKQKRTSDIMHKADISDLTPAEIAERQHALHMLYLAAKMQRSIMFDL